jgi:hypothetical protein
VTSGIPVLAGGTGREPFIYVLLAIHLTQVAPTCCGASGDILEVFTIAA